MRIIFGPPGTGKTTKLLGLVAKPEDTAFVAFSKKAAREAVERGGFSEERTRHWRTLHSTAYRMLGLKRGDVMQRKNYREIGNFLGLPMGVMTNVEDLMEPRAGVSRGDKALFVVGLARAMMTSVEDAWAKADIDDVSLQECVAVAEAVVAYKRKFRLLDFEDMLERGQDALPVKRIIIDEAQDLTPTQWDFVQRISRNAEEVIVAGDDDQAIYEWSGAEPETLINMEGEREVLPQSHRLPRSVHAYASWISSMIRQREPKDFLPREEDGLVSRVLDAGDVDVRSGKWLLLARHRAGLKKYADICRSLGIVYEQGGAWSNTEPPVQAALDYERLRAGKSVGDDRAGNVAKFASGAKWKRRERMQEWNDLFPPADIRPDWMTSLDRMTVDDREYIRACRNNGESLVRPGRVVISTIHAAKGGEADNVLLDLFASPACHRKIAMGGNDEEMRVWYVAATRARQNLFLLSSDKAVLP